MATNLEKIKGIYREIHQNIVSKATPKMYFTGEFEELVNKSFNDLGGEKLNYLISIEENKKGLEEVLKECNKAYEEELTNKFFQCCGLERD